MANNNELFGEVSEYEFHAFSPNDDVSGKARNFEFKEIGQLTPAQTNNLEVAIKTERVNAEKSDFQISPIVKEHRGINKQVLKEREVRIEEEVKRRVAAIQENAYKAGFEEGVQNGRDEVFAQNKLASEEKLQNLTNMIVEVLHTRSEILLTQKKQIYGLVRNLTKWIVLRELKDDGQYIENLLEKLITEIQTKSNLLIHVDQKSFEQMPDVLQTVQEKLGELHNVRVEIDYDIEGPGIVLECDKGILNGSINQQMKSLDKLFEPVGLLQDEVMTYSEVQNPETASLDKVVENLVQDDDSDSEES
ncbi:FliH/SctL family protein [Halobacteriovorax sp. HLS]|uniref:FliH/SctL family protein n=1 Tax=Halobacteriovorax sp. HLS TaxID=2234000 RepID=UPI000FDA72E2|nr:FliH/SctL family protein [Halobacteriovorax sp. HLS]